MIEAKSMSKDMNLIMENWRRNVLEESEADKLYERLVNEFVNDLKILSENEAPLNEILSKVGDFAKKAFNSYKALKKGTIQKVLETAISGALKVIPLIKDKFPEIASKIERVLNELKKDENMTIAISMVSILVGLMTGEAFDALEEVLSVIGAAPNLIQAYETISTITDTADVAKVLDKSGQLVNVAAVAQ